MACFTAHFRYLRSVLPIRNAILQSHNANATFCCHVANSFKCSTKRLLYYSLGRRKMLMLRCQQTMFTAYSVFCRFLEPLNHPGKELSNVLKFTDFLNFVKQNKVKLHERNKKNNFYTHDYKCPHKSKE